MLAPKRLKHRRQFRGIWRKTAIKGEKINFGSHGIKSLESGWVTDRQSEAEKIYKKAMEKVGELLNHKTGIGTTEKVTGTTAIQSYIDPQLQIQFFEDLGLRTPTFLEKLK
jgi:ribosomal protein L16/L10AE